MLAQSGFGLDHTIAGRVVSDYLQSQWQEFNDGVPGKKWCGGFL